MFHLFMHPAVITALNMTTIYKVGKYSRLFLSALIKNHLEHSKQGASVSQAKKLNSKYAGTHLWTSRVRNDATDAYFL